jgi:undecaprenyl-diphosphatase
VSGIFEFDVTVFRAVNVGLHSAVLDPIFWLLTQSGRGEVQFLGCLLFALSSETRRFVTPLLTVILFAGLPVAQGLKSLIPRDRPSNLYFAIREDDLWASSFPSGHTTTSFAIATMLVLLTRKTPLAWVGWLAIPWAALVGVSRIYRGVHWPTDVVAGMCCGIFSACLIDLVFDNWGSIKGPFRAKSWPTAKS